VGARNWFFLWVAAVLACLSMSAAQASEDGADARDGNGNGKGGDVSGFGVTVGLAAEHYRKPYIRGASTNGDQRIVTIDDESKWHPSVWSTVSWTATGCDNNKFLKHLCWDYLKPGVFAGTRLIAPDGSSLFDAFSVGVQFALLRTKRDVSAATRGSLNFGIGYVWHGTRWLQDGIQEGQELPSHFNDVKYRKSTERSWMIIVSKDVLN
jgi:hypothetical protein